MFDFMDSDWFIIGLEVLFVMLIAYDIKKYVETKKKEYITNIVLTAAFAVWTLYPFYTSYFGWEDSQKVELLSHCGENNETKLCKCLDKSTFKNYTYEEYIVLDKNSTDYKDFLKDTTEDCLDDGWF
jgi:hypothetical protein